MNDALFLFLILLLGLVLCSFLGGSCGKEGMTTNTTTTNLGTGTTYTDANGNSITVISGNSIKLVRAGDSTPIVLTTTPPSGVTATANTYYGSKITATVVTGSNGQSAINVKLDNGQTITLTQAASNSSSWTSSSSSSLPSSSAIQLQTGTVFIDPSGNTITIIVNSDGSQSLQLVQISQPNYPIILVSTPPSGTTATANTYYAQGPLKMTATVYTGSDGQTAIKITLASGETFIFSQHGSAAVSTQSNNGSITSTQYYGSTGSPYQTVASAMSYTGAYGGSAGSVTGPNGNTAYYAQAPAASTGTSSSSSDYYSSLPPGIPASQIPSGQEDLYILKSQVVPPVCPVCPAYNSSSSSSSGSNNDPDSAPKCPPCPACARCPEPSFECKKVPNYNAIENSYLPQPVISSFSAFGM